MKRKRDRKFSVTKFGEISPLWWGFEKWQILSAYLGFGKIWAYFGNKIYPFGLSFIVWNEQNWKHNLSIWSHWQGCPKLKKKTISNIFLSFSHWCLTSGKGVRLSSCSTCLRTWQTCYSGPASTSQSWFKRNKNWNLNC